MNKYDLLITGVGGQGNILASDIVGEAALAAGYDVKKTDTLGMAQRGGSVISHLRIARHVNSPLIRQGDVDILLAFEKLEAARWIQFLKPGAVAIVNDHSLPPLSVNVGNETYPEDQLIMDILAQKKARVHFVEGTQKVIELGNIRTLNIFMLGCLSVLLPIDTEVWKESIRQHLPERLVDINVTAFESGRKEIPHGNV